MSSQRNDSVSQIWSPQGWNLEFRRALNDWEISEIAGLLQLLSSFSGTSNCDDKPIWQLHSKGVFTVKSCYWGRNTTQLQIAKWPLETNMES